MRPGEIVLARASRSFALDHDRSRTLKELFVRRARSGRDRVHALADVSLTIEPGEAVGMVGRNGAGKTSTLRCLAGIVPLDSGRADCGGNVVSLLELGAGFGPDFSGRENIYLSGALHGFTREEIDARMQSIVEFSELGEFLDVPVRAYSAGMQLRLGFSIVAHLDADVLLIDEILAVGDESFQRKCLKRISDQMARGATLVLVSHDPTAIERICERVVVLDDGRVAFDGPVAEGLLHYHRMLGTEHGSSQAVRPADRRAALTVEELELQDSGGRRRHMFRTGEPLAVAVRVAAAVPQERALLALEVRDARGELVFRTDTALGSVDGEVHAGFEVSRLALLGGDYDLAVGAYGQDAPESRLLDRVARFSVAASSDGEGIADLRGSWTVAEQRSAEEALRP
ncbi:MAG TPA: ABC transporter ATP-binding protein [Thermoleophilaceae bacterium]|nr:ABC transporter ATP-binding protein [Thermoleophilaceae bacterium]